MAVSPSGTTAKFRYRPELNGLRAIAVTAVVLFHASTPGFASGYLGVDVFFVLSGFLITSVLAVESKNNDPSGSIDLLGFYSKRVRRLMPAATIVLLCTAVAYRFAVDPLSCSRSVNSFLSAAYYVANWAFIAVDGDYWAEDMLVSPVKHYWSLSVEEQFYLGYPLVFLSVVRLLKTPGTFRRLFPFVGITVCLLSLMLATLLYYEGKATASYMNTAARFYQLLGGGLLAMMAPGCVLPSYVSTLGIMLMTGLLLSSGALSSLWGGFAAFITSCIVILGLEGIPQEAAHSSWTKRLLSVRPLIVVGECSYSIYLVHFPLVVIGDAIGLLPSREQAIARTFFMLSASLALGWLLRNLIEIPSRQVSLQTRNRKLGAALCIIIVPVMVTFPLLGVLNPPMHNAEVVRDHFVPATVIGHIEGGKSAASFVTIGDSHCSTSNDMMKAFFSEQHVDGRSFCRGSFPANFYPDYKQEDADFLDVILSSLRDEPTDYLVVWNVKVQHACVYMGKSCPFDSPLNEAVDEVHDLYEPYVLQFFEELLPYVRVAVLIMLPEPVAPFNPRICLSHNQDSSLCDWNAWHMPGYVEAVQAYQAVAEASVAKDGPQVLLFDTDEILCPQGKCRAVDHGIALFKDRNHINPSTWVRLLPAVKQLWLDAGVSFAHSSSVPVNKPKNSESVAHALLGDLEDEFTEIMREYYEDLLPFMERETAPTHEDYVTFARQFKQNRVRAAAIRPYLGHVSAAFVTTQDLLTTNKPGMQRPDLRESIAIPLEVVDEELTWALAHEFRPTNPPRWPLLADQGCTEANLFCLNQPWPSLAIMLEADLVCLWDAAEGWAADVERLLGYDVLILLDSLREEIDTVLQTLDEVHFKGSVYVMASESSIFGHGGSLEGALPRGVCTVILDNYSSLKEAHNVPKQFYPLWSRHRIAAWQEIDHRPAPTNDSWQRREVFIARVPGRPKENDQFVEESKEAASFFSERGYVVIDENSSPSGTNHYRYSGRYKYAFLPMDEGNSAGQIIVDALVFSNFTTLPFLYGHKLWMRALPPFLTIQSVFELQEKVKFLDSNEEEYWSLLEDVQQFAPAFIDQNLGETALELVAAIAVAPPSIFPGDHRDCLRLPSLSTP